MSLDGNLIQDGRWNWEWDGENRLKAMETNPFAAAAGVPLQRLEFVYDSQSRRIRKLLKEWDAIQETFVLKKDTRFLYDGWNVIAEFESGASFQLALKATYAWGLDLSGAETGAGGVGGLLLVKLHSTASTTANNSQPSSTSVLAPCYDGNGNILAYLDCATGQTLARYEFDPFGKLLLKDEDTRVAGRLHHQFSTKYTDDETGLSYYGYRYYSPDLGRWVNRDPIGERGGVNLYGMVANDPNGKWDRLGLDMGSTSYDYTRGCHPLGTFYVEEWTSGLGLSAVLSGIGGNTWLGITTHKTCYCEYDCAGKRISNAEFSQPTGVTYFYSGGARCSDPDLNNLVNSGIQMSGYFWSQLDARYRKESEGFEERCQMHCEQLARDDGGVG